jgi:hypothetical protein
VLTKRHHFLCQLGWRRTAPAVVVRDHSMFLGARWWILRALRPAIIHRVQNMVGNEVDSRSLRQTLGNLAID